MKDRGFTMIELVVVIAVAAIAVAMAFPTFMAERDRSRVKGAGRDLVSNFQTARINAMRGARIWGLVFDVTGNAYALVNAGDDGVMDTEDDLTVKTVTLSGYGDVTFGIGDGIGARPGGVVPENGAVTFSGNKVNFSPDGAGDRSGTVYVKNGRGQTFAVGSITVTGRVKAWANYGGGWEE